MAEEYSVVYMYHIFFIHSFFDGHLVCFHILAIVNRVEKNIAGNILSDHIFSGYKPRSGVVVSYGSSSFSLRNLHMISIMAVAIYIPTGTTGGFLFCHTIASISVCRPFFFLTLQYCISFAKFRNESATGLFKWVSSLHQVTKVLELQLQNQSFQWIFRTDFP